MSLKPLARHRSRLIAAGLVAVVALGGALTNAADAAKPAGSRTQVFVETGQDAPTLNPASAITSGWWGHEGGANDGTGTGATVLSMDGSDGAGTVNQTTINAMLAAMGTDDTSKIGYAIVPTSADGSNEDPSVTAGQNAGEVFANGWILSEGLGGSLNGTTNANDSVTTVSTLAQITAWVGANRPLQGYDSNLVLHDVSDPTHPVSAQPQGSSILKTWPAGTALSLVAYVTNGTDPDLQNVVPLVAVGSGGKAETAWMPFVTVAKAGDAVRTSAGYQVVGAYAPTVSLSHSFAGSTATLTATVKDKDNATATNATGSMEFYPVVNGTRAGSPSATVATTNGAASLQVPGFTSGSTKVFDVRYVPDVAASGTYLTTDYARRTITAPISTTTTLAITGGAAATFTAAVNPKVAGTVTFKDGTKVLGAAVVSAGSAKLVKALAVGKHVVSATFAPSSNVYSGSSATKTVWVAGMTAKLTPVTGKHGVAPTLKVTVVASGATVSGKVVVTFDPPSGATKKFTLTLVKGVASIKLPKTVKGSTKITVAYGGNTQILSAVKVLIFKAT